MAIFFALAFAWLVLPSAAGAAGESGSFEISIPQGSQAIVLAICIVYFLAVLGFGLLFGRFSRDTHDFFYSGQRFPWWLITASMVATGIGSYSFLKYAQAGYNSGLSSTMTYLNDWFVMPFFMFGWLPIIYFSRVRSIPEYFERRFNVVVRYLAMIIILAYMLYYIGYNLFTMGLAIQGITGVNIWIPVLVCTLIIGFYVTTGGQTAVIFTDLLQGFMLYLAGAVVLVGGLIWLGGFGEFWGWLPVELRSPFAHINATPRLGTANTFWGEGIAGSIAFTFMNQGFIMRYLAAKSVNEGRKAAVANVVILLPLSAVVVSCAGWVGRAMMTKGAAQGLIPFELHDTYHTFTTVLWTVMRQNAIVFGFIMAALLAALMSTVDTLINACAAIGVNDLYRRLVKKEHSEKHYLVVARVVSVVATGIGLLLVWMFTTMEQDLFNLHYKGVMVIIPAMVTVIFMGAFWPRFTSAAAVAAMIGGSAINFLSLTFTQWVDPLSRFLLAYPPEGTPPEHSVFRGIFGCLVTATIGIVVTLFTPRPSETKIRGLTVFSLEDAMRSFKAGLPNFRRGRRGSAGGLAFKVQPDTGGRVLLPGGLMEDLAITEGDLVYVADDRWWLGGLRSVQLKAGRAAEEGVVVLAPEEVERGSFDPSRPLRVEKIM
ncbi:sodium:solute symporter family protein [Candidatus Fermentibacteria bacterium]|nr:sodium:solute symporter family protein [Candidatus Fermentibacteria bacterium]